MKEIILLEQFINAQKLSNAERMETLNWLANIQRERQETASKLQELSERLESLKKIDAD